MQFPVPQFIEYEPKIFGPFTFKQFIVIGGAGGVCFVLYFVIPTFYFFLATAVIMGSALAMIFLKIKGQILPVFLKNLLFFKIRATFYLWRRKEMPVFLKTVGEKPKEEEEKEEELPLKIAERSRLKRLKKELETKTR